MSEQWGVGNSAKEKPFATTKVEGEVVELIFGEHPHSRSANTVYARWPDGSIEGFDGHRTCLRIDIKESNYLKRSELSGNEVRKSCVANMYYDDKLVYVEGARSADALLRRLPDVLMKLDEHPADLRKGDADLVGRTIYYNDQPATIESYDPETGSMHIKPDGCTFKKPAWARGDEDEWADGVSDDLLSPSIYWFRQTGEDAERDAEIAKQEQAHIGKNRRLS